MTTKISTNNLDSSVTTLIAQGGGPKITAIAYPGNDTAADTAGGQTITLTGSGFAAGAAVVINGQAVGVVTVANSSTITFVSPALSAGSYIIYVINTDGGTAIAVPGIQYSGTPAWSTAAGTLGSYTETQAINNTVTATGDAPVTYSVFSGTLPPGASLNANTGVISGTSALTPNSTTYTFTVRATDAQNQDTDRQFTLTINPDAVTWSNPAANTNYASTVNAAIANVSLSAAAASGQPVTYTANALPTGLSLAANVITGTPTTTGNVVTLLTATATATNATATRTISWTISVANDVNFPNVTTLLSANTPASTFVADASANAFAVTVNGDTRPTNFGPYTPGYYSGYFDGTGDYLSVPNDAAFNLSTGSWTIECWVYMTAGSSYRTFISKRTGATSQWELGIDPSSYLYFYTSTVYASSTVVPNNIWTHCAASYDGTNLRLFVNGVVVLTQAGITAAAGSDPVFIGQCHATGQPITGYLSNLRVVKGTAVYTAAFTPPAGPLTAIANTSLLTCQSNRFIDNSTNNFTVTRNGDTLISGFDPFVPSSNFVGRGSGFFDGTSDYLTLPNNAAFAFGTGAYTVESWIYATESQTFAVIFTAGVNGLQFGIDANGYIAIAQTNINFELNSTTTMPLNQWNHVAVSRNGANVTSIFLNGSRIASGTVSTNYSSATGYINLNPYNSNDITGYFSNLRVVKGTAVYDPTQTTITVPTTPLTAIANTSLLILQNNQPNNNNMFLDSGTNNFTITRNGNTTQGTFSPYGGAWSNYFNGSTDYFSMSDNNAFQYGAGDFALECWVYPTAALSGNYIVSQWYTGDKGVILGIAGGSLSFYYSTTGSNDIILVSATNPALNQWSHLLACRTGNTISVYLNGTRVATTTESGTLYNSTSTIGIATHVQGLGSSLWPGYISNLRSIAGSHPYNAAQTTITVPTAPLTAVANTRLLICADNRFIDDGPSNFTLTRAGTPSIQRFSPFSPVVTAPTSYSAYFDGTGDYLTVPTNSAFAFGSGSFTIEAWIYPLVSATEMFITTEHNYGSLASHYFRITSGNLLNGIVYINNTDTGLTSDAVVPSNQWSHVVFARSSNTLILGLNGVVKTTAVNGSLDVPSQPFNIGRQTNDTRFFNGYISNLRVVKGTAVYTTNFTPSTTPLSAIANTSLLTLQSATFTDTSANAFAITANGDAAPRQFNPFGWTTTTGTSAAYTPALYGGSAYFDGTGDYLNFTGGAATAIGTSSATVEFWMYATANDGYRRIICSTSGGFSSGTFVIRFNNGGFLAGSGTTHITVATLPVTNRWYHVAWVGVGSTSQTLYLDGVSVGTAGSYDLTESISLIGGYYSVSSSEWFAGYLSDVRITKGQALYRSNFQPPVSPLTAIQNTVLLNNMTGAGIYDSSMMNNYETVGDARINTASIYKYYGNTSMYFDGTTDYIVTPTSPVNNIFSGNFTIEFWIYLFVPANQQTLVQVGSASNNRAVLYMLSSRVTLFTSGNGTNLIQSSVLSANTWYHVALTKSGTTTTLWLNGTSAGTSTSVTYPTGNLQNMIGYNAYGSADSLNGYIDDLRITNGIARYTTTFTPTSTPFISN